MTEQVDSNTQTQLDQVEQLIADAAARGDDLTRRQRRSRDEFIAESRRQKYASLIEELIARGVPQWALAYMSQPNRENVKVFWDDDIEIEIELPHCAPIIYDYTSRHYSVRTAGNIEYEDAPSDGYWFVVFEDIPMPDATFDQAVATARRYGTEWILANVEANSRTRAGERPTPADPDPALVTVVSDSEPAPAAKPTTIDLVLETLERYNTSSARDDSTVLIVSSLLAIAEQSQRLADAIGQRNAPIPF